MILWSVPIYITIYKIYITNYKYFENVSIKSLYYNYKIPIYIVYINSINIY